MAVAGDNLPDAESVLVAYSGGKDSLAVLDLCCRAGKRVEAYFMYFLPGMDYTEHWCSYAEQRFGVKVHRVQHFITSYYLARGVFRDFVEDCPVIKHNDVERMVRERTGIEWVGYGYKLSDGPSRRAYLTFMSDWGVRVDPETRKLVYSEHAGRCEKLKRFSPIMAWKDRDVMAYLTRRRIEIPGMSNRKVNGIALLPDVLAQIRDMWPDDYRRILGVFPYAAAQADRAELVKGQRQKYRAALRALEAAGLEAGPVASQPAPATTGSATA